MIMYNVILGEKNLSPISIFDRCNPSLTLGRALKEKPTNQCQNIFFFEISSHKGRTPPKSFQSCSTAIHVESKPITHQKQVALFASFECYFLVSR
jgi:hypothetical protein